MSRYLLFIFPFWLMAAQPIVEWHRFHFPPSLFYNDSGSDKTQGYSDKPRTFMTAHITGYQHVDFPASPNKAVHIAKNDSKRTVCFAGFNKNAEREKYLIFSKPFLSSYPNHLVAKKENPALKKLLKPDGTISLKELLQSGALLSIAKSRSYSPKIDVLLKAYQGKNLIYPPSGDISFAYLRQVIRDRVDATIDYPANINYFSSTKPKINANEFQTYPISEDYGMLKVYFACSRKSGIGEKIIVQVNQLIDQNRRLFAENYAEWLNKESAEIYLQKDWK